MSIILPTQLWTVQHLLLFGLSSFPFFLITSLIFFTFQKITLQNNSALLNLKCDWFISFIQVERNRTHPIPQKLFHTNICISSLYEFAILHSQTSWIMQVLSYKSFNVRAALKSTWFILLPDWLSTSFRHKYRYEIWVVLNMVLSCYRKF